MVKALTQKASMVKLLICDVDGVLTDGLLHTGLTGLECLTFHVHDGIGLKLLMQTGVDVAVITASTSSIIDCRMQQLGIKHCFKNQHDKMVTYEQLCQQLKLEDKHIAYIGDDLTDGPVMARAGLGISVANACAGMHQYSTWTTQNPGGHGAVREVCDLIMTAQNTHEMALKALIAHSG